MKFLNKKTIFAFVLMISLLISGTSVIFAAKKKKKSGPEQITIQVRDGFKLVGNLYRPKNASIKNKVPVVFLLHSIGSTADSWKNFPLKLVASDKAVLALNMRGHGASILNKYDKRRDWVNFTNKEFQKYPNDINDAIKYLKDNCPELNTAKVGIVAANISANSAVLAARDNSKVIKTLVLLSPTASYKGIDPRIPLVDYGNHPVLIMASKKDSYSYKGSSELIKYAQGVKTLKVFPSGGNGADLLRFQPQSESIIVDWINKNLK